MADAMVTGRISSIKKEKGLRVLERNGVSASRAINLMFDRAIDSGNVDFLGVPAKADESHWKEAALFVDGLSEKRETKFDSMDKAEIKADRLASRGLM